MIPLAISLLWLAIGVVILGGVVWILLSIIQRFFPGAITDTVVYMVWAIFAILILIFALTALLGGGVPHINLR